MQINPGVFVQIVGLAALSSLAVAQIGTERSIDRHLRNNDEFELPLHKLIEYGESLFRAMWTGQEGGGRPLSKGTGPGLSDPTAPLKFPRNFNRISGPDANSCAGCHALPRVGGGGDVVANVFVLGQRFDFATFDSTDLVPTRGSRDERGHTVTQQTVSNERATLGMFGSGFIEMLARQMTADLQRLRDATRPGQETSLVSKGVQFGTISRTFSGEWITKDIQGLPSASLDVSDPNTPPTLIIRPFHQAGRVVSLREFSNNAFNHHHGIQSSERFGSGTDPDGDGFTDEMTRADITAVSVYQATLPVPGRVIPRDREVEEAIFRGEIRFNQVGCAQCHIPSLPIADGGWIYSEPNPYNPPGNLRLGEAPDYQVDLTSDKLPLPRLTPDRNGVVHVPAYTDLKLHDICSGPDDPNAEPLDMQHAPGTDAFFGGNTKFLTKKLWGAASEPPYFHHGKFTTLREAIAAHAGEALISKNAFLALAERDQNALIEFLKSLRTLPPGTKFLVVDEKGAPRYDLIRESSGKN